MIRIWTGSSASRSLELIQIIALVMAADIADCDFLNHFTSFSVLLLNPFVSPRRSGVVGLVDLLYLSWNDSTSDTAIVGFHLVQFAKQISLS